MSHRWLAAATIACVTTLGGSLAYGQETLQQIKALYASAAYEEALSMVTRLQASSPRPELEQYRVFCLVALGRTAEAERVIATVVSANPAFVPDAAETSPRIHGMFLRIRRGLIPEIAQRMYLEGRGALERKDKAAASSHFDALVRLIDSASAGQADTGEVGPLLPELRLLASGFLDLSRALPETPSPDPAAAAPDVSPVAPPAAGPGQLTSPVPLKQNLPVWIPPDQGSRRVFRGAIRVFISNDGRVTGAELAPAIHPAYDRQLLLAARTWEYQPALRNGAPIASEKVIEVVLQPR